MVSPGNAVSGHDPKRRTVAVERRSEDLPAVVASPYLRWKGILDRVLAAILLVPGLPIIVLLALLVRLTSAGPGIFRQRRVGKNHRYFTLLKIRTMRIDAEKATGPAWSQPHDDRVTRVGRVLRKLHLDELPQLINVLKGDMSLIGPRPERPEFVRVLSEAIPGYGDRLAVTPGITGLAQLNLPPDSDVNSVRRKLHLDVRYIKEAGLWLDLRILLGTVARVLKLPVLRLLRLQRSVPDLPAEGPLPAGKAGSINGKATLDQLLRHGSLRGKHSAVHSGGNGDAHGNGHGNGHANGQQAAKSQPRFKPR
jgi:lipopolysaccharide/colanic/teichoic acid biosynthesis glycosyltransferase